MTLSLRRRIERQLLHTDTWVFLTVVLFFSDQRATASATQDWSAFGTALGYHLLLAAPVLLYSAYRSRWIGALSPAPRRLLWAACFLGAPLLLTALMPDGILNHGLPYYPLQVGAALLLTELLLFAARRWSDWGRHWRWPRHIGLEGGIVLTLAIAALGLSTLELFGEQIFSPATSQPAARQATRTTAVFSSHSLQYFLILLTYYGFYLINHYLLISKVLKQRGLFYYAMAFLGTVLLFYPLAAEFISWLPMVRQHTIHPVTEGRIFHSINAVVPLAGMLLSIPFVLAVQWSRQGSALATLQRDRTQSELTLLKSQLNPHFFFNTLNNLYALSLTQDRATPEVVLRLAELMRYVIYRGQEEKVPLAEEIAYIEDYLELQTLRLNQDLDLRFERELADARFPVPPLLLITFVENAFKHGIEPAAGAGYLHLSLRQTPEHLTFTCQNSLESDTGSQAPDGGVGLANLERRLALLFPGRYVLTTTRSSAAFHAILQIQFA
jgi:hypothetical protein